MALKLQSLLGIASDLIPGGAVARSLAQGAGGYLLKKAASEAGVKPETIDLILVQAQKIAAQDEQIRKSLSEEEEMRRQFDLAFYGRVADLSPAAQLWRTITRPLLSMTMIGLLTIGILIQYGQQVIFGVDETDLLRIPVEVVELSKWVIAFWFTSRGVEKVVGLFR